MFVLAHLSDPHLPLQAEPRLGELLGKRATGYFNLRVNRRARHRLEVLERIIADLRAQAPHHVAVTGDLVNVSLPGEFAPARALLDRLGPPEHVSLVPGNHDAYVRAEAATHLAAWGEYARGDAAREPGFPYVRRRGPVALVGLSTAVPTPLFSSSGRLGRDQIEAAAALLKKLRGRGLFRVVLIHHPPAGRRAWHKRLRDAAQLRAVIAEHGAELLLHGHDHKASLAEIAGPNGPVPVVGVPSASAAADDPRGGAAYNLYRIAGEAGAWYCELERRAIAPDGSVVVQQRVVLAAPVEERKPAQRPAARAPRLSAAQTAKRSQRAKRRRPARR
jgi:3',5'-cyclic AMP phosphodiesterase CpdA